jgi:hypothetical protein
MYHDGRENDRFKIRDLLADTRCSEAVLNFLSTMDVGSRVTPQLKKTHKVRRWSVSSGSGGEGKR